MATNAIDRHWVRHAVFRVNLASGDHLHAFCDLGNTYMIGEATPRTAKMMFVYWRRVAPISPYDQL